MNQNGSESSFLDHSVLLVDGRAVCRSQLDQDFLHYVLKQVGSLLLARFRVGSDRVDGDRDLQ